MTDEETAAPQADEAPTTIGTVDAAVYARPLKVVTWAFLFFLPLTLAHFRVPLPFGALLPDPLAWLLIVVAFLAVPGVRAHTIRRLALIGLSLSVARTGICFVLSAHTTQHALATFLGLHAAAVAAEVVAVWAICAVVREVAEQAGRRSVARSAATGRALFVVHAVLVWLAPAAYAYVHSLVRARPEPQLLQFAPLVVVYVMLLANGAILSYMMFLTDRAGRLCRQTADGTDL
jgi:hypothetical protein